MTGSTIEEFELKAAVPDPDACARRVEGAGARLVFAGRLLDRRWDTAKRALRGRDEVLRLRTSVADDAPHAPRHVLDWKGPRRLVDGYKVRTERSTTIGDAETMAAILAAAGFVVTLEIEREVAQYALGDATLRFERYPRMDVLLEVEGTPAAIERAIAATGLPRAAFSDARLADFVAAFERRTRTRGAICARELAGERPYRAADA